MSLPSYAVYYDHENKVLYQHFINVGWFLTEDNWTECVQSLPKIYGTSHIKVYHIDVPCCWLNNHETDLRRLYLEDQEEYRRTHIGLTKKEVETKLDTTPIKERTILANQIAVLIPIIRKQMPISMATDIVGVQPMTGSGQIFSMKVRYSSKYRFIRYLEQQYSKLKESVDKYIIFGNSIIRYYSKNK